jgi:nucleotide-binding universal stress UspA family protein
MSCVLACIDLSDVTDAVLSCAVRLANAIGQELVVLHVAAPDPDFVGYEAGPQSVRDQVAKRLREDHRKLEQRVKLATGSVAARALMVQGSAAERIEEHAGRLGAELIVLGSHGHGRLRRLLVGSVTNAVLKRSTIPVVIVPSPRASASNP